LQQRHFDGDLRCFVTFLFGAGDGLIFGVTGEHAIANRHIVIEADARDARCGFVADDLKMIGLALDDAAQCDKCIEVLSRTERLQSKRNFQRAGYGNFSNIVHVNAHVSECFFCACEQFFADRRVKARSNDADVQASATKFHEGLKGHIFLFF